MSDLEVRVGEQGGRIQSVLCQSGDTVKTALEIAEVNVGERVIRMDGNVVTESSLVSDGAVIIIQQKKYDGGC